MMLIILKKRIMERDDYGNGFSTKSLPLPRKNNI